MSNRSQTGKMYELVESLTFNGKKYLLRDSNGIELVWDERSVKGLIKSGSVIKGLRLNMFGKIVKVR